MNDLKIDIDHLAKLARIELGEADKGKFLDQMQTIIQYCSRVCMAPVDDLEPMVHSFDHKENFWAEDVTQPAANVADVLKNAPQIKEHQIVVPKVL